MVYKSLTALCLFIIISMPICIFAQNDSIISDEELMQQVDMARKIHGKSFSKEWSDTVPNSIVRKKEYVTDTFPDGLSYDFKNNPFTKKGLPNSESLDSIFSKMGEGFKQFNLGDGFKQFNFKKNFEGADSLDSHFQGFSFDGENFKQFGQMDTALLNQFKKQMQGFSMNLDGSFFKNFNMNDLMKEMQQNLGGMPFQPFDKDNKRFKPNDKKKELKDSKKKDYETESF